MRKLNHSARRPLRRAPRRVFRLQRSGQAQRALFSQLEAALVEQPGCVVMGTLEWDRRGRVMAASDAVLGCAGFGSHAVASGELRLEMLFEPSALATLKSWASEGASPPRQALSCAIRARGRTPVSVMLCLTLAVTPPGHTLALVLGSASVNVQLQLDALILGVVSHELRTPLGVISMAANLLLSDDISAAQRRTVQRIATASRHSDRLVSDLLDFTAARGSGITLLRGQRDLHTIAAQALDDLRVTWPGRDVEHERLGDAESFMDEDRVAQIISNLVNNALQHSPPGARVMVQTRGEPGAAVLSVTNLGPPIPAELMTQLFSPLQRGDNAGRRRGSLGLGLFIVRHLVTAHDGTIDVRSNGTDGTTFTIRFPHQPPTAA